ncbi:FG-GAP-like repeat-containing protein [Isosphaeraceae bacterium EP7]
MPDAVVKLRTKGKPGRRFRPALAELEPRLPLAGDLAVPTADEQYMLELINRMRANPAAEGQRMLAQVRADPVLQSATRNWDMNQFVRVISAFAASPPLAFNTRLIAAARVQNGAMLAMNNQVHAPQGFLTDPAVARAADGQAYYPVNNLSWSTGENIFAYSEVVQKTRLRDYVDYLHAGFVIDWGNPDYGHLHNLLAPGPSGTTFGTIGFSEIGVGLLTGAVPTAPSPNSNDVGPVLVTQEFGWHTGNPFLTGTFYKDTDGDNFYSPGEGLGSVTITATRRGGGGTFQATTWASGGYSLAIPSGIYDVTTSGAGTDGLSTVVTIGQDNVGWGAKVSAVSVTPAGDTPIPGDYDGDHKADRAVYQPSTARWFVRSSLNGSTAVYTWGVAGSTDTPAPADYDGDGKTDLAIYQPSTGRWQIRTMTSTPGTLSVVWGQAGAGDIPVPGDYDGDGKADIAVFRPSTAQWFILGSATGPRVVTFGLAGVDLPVPADYSGDGKLELATYRPSTGQWFLGTATGSVLINGHVWGQAGSADVPVPADYDGDGRADLAVYRPGSGQWFLNLAGAPPFTWGAAGSTDQPAPADYDGDRKADLAVYRPENANWYTSGSTAGQSAILFGRSGTGTSTAMLASQGVTAIGTFTGRTSLAAGSAAGIQASSATATNSTRTSRPRRPAVPGDAVPAPFPAGRRRWASFKGRAWARASV